MSNSPFDDKLRAHYDRHAMSGERLSLLAALATGPDAPPAARPRGIFAPSGGFSRAAAIFLFFVSGALAMQWTTARQTADDLGLRLARVEKHSSALDGELTEARGRCAELERRLDGGGKLFAAASDADSPRYVVVRIASSRCVSCGKTREFFEKLLEQHAADDVVFVNFDVSSPAERTQAQRLACNLGLKWAAGDCGQCCAIRLFDRRQKQLVATQYALNSTDEFERMFDETLKKAGG